MQQAYKTIERDPTNKLKAKLITMLRKIKSESGLEENLYKSIIQWVAPPLHFMDCLKHINQAPTQAY